MTASLLASELDWDNDLSDQLNSVTSPSPPPRRERLSLSPKRPSKVRQKLANVHEVKERIKGYRKSLSDRSLSDPELEDDVASLQNSLTAMEEVMKLMQVSSSRKPFQRRCKSDHDLRAIARSSATKRKSSMGYKSNSSNSSSVSSLSSSSYGV